MRYTAVAWSIALTVVAGAARADSGAPVGTRVGAERVTLETNRAGKAEVAARLGEALGGDVRFEGAVPDVISLALTDIPVKSALDKIAADLGGKWTRVYQFAKEDAAAARVPARSGQKLTLRVTDIPCDTAAAMVGRMASAKIEKQGEMEGTVTLSATDMPVEEALDVVAKAAGMQWHPIYILKVDAAPAATPAAAPRPAAARAPAPEPTPKEPSQLIASPGHKRTRPLQGRIQHRTKQNQLGVYGAKRPEVHIRTDQEAETYARLGQFGPIFTMDSKTDRARRIKQFRSSLETAARRLDTYAPRYRLAAMRVTAIQLQQLLLDYNELTDEQKKEAEPIIEFVKDRLKEAETLEREQRQ